MKLPKLKVPKNKIVLFSLAAVIVISLMLTGIEIGLNVKANDKQVIVTHSSQKSQVSKPKVSTLTTQQSTQPSTNSPASTTSSTYTPTSKPASTPSPTSPAPAPTQPETLTSCTYSNGPQAGNNCPINPPPSYSYSNAYPYACYYTNPPNGSAPGPSSCPPYNDVTSIVGEYNSGYNAYYCHFYYAQYNGVSGINKSDRVNDYSGNIPDCSLDTLYY